MVIITPRRATPELPAIKIVQAGVDIYLSAIPISTLADWKESGRLDVAEWRPQDAQTERTQDNYQRQLETIRSVRIKKYAELPPSETSLILPIFAQSILLNVRSAPGTRKPKIFFGNGQTGTLRFPASLQFKIWEVDGQHRIEGLISAYEASNRKFSKYLIPIAIMNGLTLGQEAAQFLIINTTQKPVRYDLELRVLSERERGNPSFPKCRLPTHIAG